MQLLSTLLAQCILACDNSIVIGQYYIQTISDLYGILYTNQIGVICINQSSQSQRTASQSQRASQSQSHQLKKRSKPNILAFYTSNEEIT